MSEAEAARLVDVPLESRRADYVVIDDFERIRFVTPEEWPQAIADCLTVT